MIIYVKGFLALVEHLIKTKDIKSFYFDNSIDNFRINHLIFKVAKKENLEILEMLYNVHPFDPNMSTNSSYGSRVSESLLHVSIKKDNAKMVKFLVSLDNININKIYLEGDISTYDNRGEEEDESDTYFDIDLDDSCVKVKKQHCIWLLKIKIQKLFQFY